MNRITRNLAMIGTASVGSIALLGTTPLTAGADTAPVPPAPVVTSISDSGATITATITEDASAGATDLVAMLVNADGDVIGSVTLDPDAHSVSFAEVPAAPGYTVQVYADAVGGTSDTATSATVDVPMLADGSNATMPAPPTPTGVRASAGDGSITVSWDAFPPDLAWLVQDVAVSVDGSAAGCITSDATQTDCTLSGLVDGTTYSLSIQSDGLDSSSASTPVGAITPIVNPGATTPGAPGTVSASGQDGTAWISITAPTSDGGSPIEYYLVTAYDGSGAAVGTCTATPYDTSGEAGCSVDGLTTGSTYTFSAVAVNGAGRSASTTSDPTTITSSEVASIAPLAVVDTSIGWVVIWQEPSDVSNIASYLVSADGGLSCTADSQQAGDTASCLLSTAATEPTNVSIEALSAVAPIMYTDAGVPIGIAERADAAHATTVLGAPGHRHVHVPVDPKVRRVHAHHRGGVAAAAVAASSTPLVLIASLGASLAALAAVLLGRRRTARR